jgi:fructokinase
VGALGLVLEPMATALEALVDRVAGQALVMVDPNWRPAARPDRQRILRVMAQADVVKVSTEDLAHMAIGDARALLTGRTRHVLVTDGPAPVRALSAGGELTMPVPAVAVVDTVGAGDAFCAGFLAAWTTDPDLEAALRLATEVSAVTCTRRGADPPRRDAL